VGVGSVGRWHVGLSPVIGWRPHWRTVVYVVGALAIGVLLLAGADLAGTGIAHPWTAVIGLVATAVVNRVYVVLAPRGVVLEAIDIAEAPIVALALLLPAGEAVVVFVVASAFMEARLERALIKKVFNVSIRAVGAAIIAIPLDVIAAPNRIGTREIVAAGIGGLGYVAFTAVAIGLVVASVHERSVRSVIRDGLAARALVWLMAVTIGVAAAVLSERAPLALVGFAATLILLGVSTRSAEKLRRESDRLRSLLSATTRIQCAGLVEDQETVLVEVARDALQWKDVEVRYLPPEANEHGRRLYDRGGFGRWLVVRQQSGSDPWLPEDEDAVDLLARSATVAFERTVLQEELARQALLDPLTGVANRRRFDLEIERLIASGQGYSIVLCDLDHFKTVNDRFGHDAGDELLRILTARLAASTRSGDLVARLGGDEFVVVLPGIIRRDDLERVRGSIAAKLEQRVTLGRWQLASLPCSLGIASGPRDGRTAREVLRVADESMYDAKNARNSTVVREAVPRQLLELGEMVNIAASL